MIRTLIVLLLAGCATVPPETRVISSATSLPPIKVPVLIPCVTAEEVPRVPPTYMRIDQSPEKKLIAALADLKELDDYLVRSQSLMLGCVKVFEAEKTK